MKPLLFIMFVTALSILVSLQFGSEVTWFNYYVGGMAGLLVSGAVLDFVSKRKLKKELEEIRTKKGR
ncbi:MAG: hypothetical protein CVU64_25050 [Deltaproteobacteria bacterium HGW-Deltaproteobacteria-21]|nr:MAG: hypothetical protein CVU64_25050 [Deltaproteobacteria bacterium HGW-Deltaproteobacteria-21]